MARSTTIDIEQAGVIHLPAHLRRKCPAGARFAIRVSDHEIIMRQIPNPDPLGRDPKLLAEFIKASDAIARDFKKRGITQSHIRRTIKKMRAERRAQSGR